VTDDWYDPEAFPELRSAPLVLESVWERVE
jgi:hypothetical protein